MVALGASADVDVGVRPTTCPVYLVLLEDEQLADAVAAELRARLTATGRRAVVLVPPVRGGAFFAPAARRRAQEWWAAQDLGTEPSAAIPIALDDATLAGLDRIAYVAVRPGHDGACRYGAAVRTVPAGTVRELVDAIASDVSSLSAAEPTGEEVSAGSRPRGIASDPDRPGTPAEPRRRVVVLAPSVRRGKRRSRAERKRRNGRGSAARLVSTTLLAGALGIGGWLVSAATSPSEAHAATLSHHHQYARTHQRPAFPLSAQLRRAGWRIVWVRTAGGGYLPQLVRSPRHSPALAGGGGHGHGPGIARHHRVRRHQARPDPAGHRGRRPDRAVEPRRRTEPRRGVVPWHRSTASPASMSPWQLLRQFGMPTGLPGTRSPISPVGGPSTARAPRTPWQHAGTPQHRSATGLSPTTTSSHHGASSHHTRPSDGPSSALPLLSLPLLGTDSEDERGGTPRTSRWTRAGPILGGDPLGGLRPTPPAGTAVPYAPGQQAQQDPCRA